jgi:hypothetical protein
MPRDNAGHTGAASRNPGGRGSEWPGEKKIGTFYLTLETQDRVKQLADQAGRSRNAFVEGLIRTHGDQYAEQLIAQKGIDAEVAADMAG